jgi:cobalamin biosynthesis protein CobT
MGGNLYKRFIDAFTDENEIPTNEKRAPLVSDEKLEDTFKTIQKTIKHEVDKMKTANKQEEKKSSRFHRWIIHYLKAPFQIWEGKKNEEVKSTVEQKNLEDEHDDEEENDELDSSSLISDTDESDDEDDDSSETDEDDEDSDEEEESSAKPIGTIKKVCVFRNIILDLYYQMGCFEIIKYHFFSCSYRLQLIVMTKIQIVKKNLMKNQQ